MRAKIAGNTGLATGVASTMMATVIGKCGYWRQRGLWSCGRRGRYVPASSSQSPRPLATVPSLSLPPPPPSSSTPISSVLIHITRARKRCVALHGSATHTPTPVASNRYTHPPLHKYLRRLRAIQARPRACDDCTIHIYALASFAELGFDRPAISLHSERGLRDRVVSIVRAAN
jgi:hypothetical protein